MVNKTLLIDIGNSCTKWALSGTGQSFVKQGLTHSHLTAEELERVWGDLEVPGQVAVSNVSGPSVEVVLRQWCVDHWQQDPWFLRSSDATLGVINAYLDPKRLGSDRMAALLGARSLTRGNVIVVDCGTAVTVDCLDSEERFRGGVIFPGMLLLRGVLAERTADINSAITQLPVPKSVLGVSTETCIASGVHFGLAGAVDRLLAEFKRECRGEQDSVTVYLTGGDAERLQPFFRTQMRHEPNLVLHGLREALKRKC